MKVLWTEQALSRLIEIEDFVAARNPVAATELTARLVACGESLRRFWRRGRRLPELPTSPLREILEGNYRIIYRSRSKAIEIVTVFEGHHRLPIEDL